MWLMLLSLDCTHLNTSGYGQRKVWSSAFLLWICSLLVNLTVGKISVALKTAGLAWVFLKFQFISCKNDFSLMIKTSNVL